MKPTGNHSGSINRAFQILDLFTRDNPELSLTDVVRSTGLNKTTAYRYLETLRDLGILSRNSESKKYHLGLKIFELGNRVRIKSRFIDVVHPYLKSLVDRLGITVHLATLDNNEVLYLDKIRSNKSLQINTFIGARAYAHCSALGKSMLSLMNSREIRTLFTNSHLLSFTENTITNIEELLKQLKNIRKKGYAIDNEEFEKGLRCVGVAIQDSEGQPIAAISVSGTPMEINEGTEGELAKALKAAVQKISGEVRDLGITARNIK